MKHKKRRFIVFSIVFLLILASGPISPEAAPKNKVTPTPNPVAYTPSPIRSLKVQFYNYYRTGSIETIYPEIRIYNTGTSKINLTDVKVRYYYTIDGERSQNYWCDWSTNGSANVTASFVKLASPLQNADHYLEIGFKTGAGTLDPGKHVEIQSRIAKSNWSAYTQTNDYSFNATSTGYNDWVKVPAYINGVLHWGTEPANKATPLPTTVPAQTPTPTPLPTPTQTLTPTPTPLPTPTPTLTPTPTPLPTPTSTPTPTKKTKKVLGFTTYYYQGDKSSYNSIQNNVNSIDEIATATHITDGSGNITGIIPAEQITLSSKNSIKPLLLVGNNFDGEVAKTLLESTKNKSNFINNLLSIMKANGYKGVNIDLEGIYVVNRNDYTTFLREVYNKLSPLGYTVSVSVPAKVYDYPGNTWNYAYDYAQISNYADHVLLMTYDEHYPGGSPGPIASINWVKNVLNYAVTVIPKEKIYLGIAAYGYEWSNSTTKAYSVKGCYNLAAANGAQIMWNDVSKSPYFNFVDIYGYNHTVWFENAYSLSSKLDLVNSFNIAGIGIWRLGLEEPDYWVNINEKIR